MKLISLIILCLMFLGCGSWTFKLGPTLADPILDHEIIYISKIINDSVVIVDTLSVLEYMENYVQVPKPQETSCNLQ
jgi:hypothetical protein